MTEQETRYYYELDKFRTLAREHRRKAARFRAREIEPEEYLAAREAMDAQGAILDEIEKEIGR